MIMQLTILGSTGSIGRSTLDVVSRHRDRYAVFALGANRQDERLAEQCLEFSPRYAVLADPESAQRLRERLVGSGCATEVLAGSDALVEVAAAPEVDAVMAAIVGAAGLQAAVAGACAGKRILLANKESLVMAGEVFLAACRASGAVVLPIDSEHNAVFQCLPPGSGRAGPGVRRIVLTASGGPFREATLEQMARATPEQACAHPNWSMGRKISVDSATMMNKGLELIEAHYLFGLPGEQLGVVVHPQSIIHSMVEYVDGSMLAQLGNPDMRTPIAHALAHPERIESGVTALDLAAIGRLDFEEPDMRRFPCLRLAREALSAGGGAPCVLNAANEVAVEAFLGGRIGFADIPALDEQVLQTLGSCPAGHDLEAVLELDAESRRLACLTLEEIAA
jgi:1-deoxy-D-xylulose-5-phosphate reductoisomerase